MTMKLEAGCKISFNVNAPTPVIFMLRPRSGLGQWVMKEEYQLTPSVPITEYTDPFGNLCQRLLAMPGFFEIQTSVTVETAEIIDVEPNAPFIPVQNLPDSVLQFLLPSRYCQADKLNQLASTIVSEMQPGYAQVEAIRHWIHSNIAYQYGTSDASTSAVETISQKIGVCRDFTHLGIALTRSINIPARMVVGYLYGLQPMDLHAWFEAYIGNRWYIFDATQSEPKGNRIAIAYGRDAADVALCTQFGPMILTQMKVWVETA